MNNSVIGLDIASGGHMLFVPTRNNTPMLNGVFDLMTENSVIQTVGKTACPPYN